LSATLEQQTMPLTEPKAEPRPYWGDWFAVVFWLSCFVIMALIHVQDLLVSLFR
jgi:hypothetical protein